MPESTGHSSLGPELPIVQYWHEDRPPDFVVELLASFSEQNPGSPHLVFSASTAEDLIRTHYGTREVAAFRACALPAMQADYFRYCAVHALGGVYVDADYRCLGSVMTLVNGPARGILHGRPGPVSHGLANIPDWPYPVGAFRTVMNGFFGFRERGHRLLELAVELATVNIENRLGEGPVGVWLAAGPGIFTSLYLLRELGSINSYAAYAARSVLAPSVRMLRQTIESPSVISRAFAGVEIRPFEETHALIAETRKPPAHRQQHWAVNAGQIYR